MTTYQKQEVSFFTAKLKQPILGLDWAANDVERFYLMFVS